MDHLEANRLPITAEVWGRPYKRPASLVHNVWELNILEIFALLELNVPNLFLDDFTARLNT